MREIKNQCHDVWQRKPKGLRYVTARGQCKRSTTHPSGRCSVHRRSWHEKADWRWDPKQRAWVAP